MKIVVDEHIDNRIVEMLHSDGYTVEFVLRAGNSDDSLLIQAQAEKSILMTADRDFGSLVFKQHARHMGVVYLRLKKLSIAARLPIIRKAIRDNAAVLHRSFTTVRPDRVIIRRPQNDDPIEPSHPTPS